MAGKQKIFSQQYFDRMYQDVKKTDIYVLIFSIKTSEPYSDYYLVNKDLDGYVHKSPNGDV